MTDRGPAANGTAGDPPRAGRDHAVPPTPFPPTRPPVPHALLDRPTALAPAGEDSAVVRPPRCERTANRLARLLRGTDARPAFAAHRLHLPDSPAAFAAALACPDLYLMDAPGGAERADLAARFADEAVAAGQRLLVLAHSATADEMVTRLARRGFRLAFCGPADGLCEDSATFGERALAEKDRAAECRRLEALVTAEAIELDRLDAIARHAAEHHATMEAARRELAELKQPVPVSHGLGGFMKKLFGGTKPVADPAERIAALEETLRLPEPERIDPAHRERVAASHRDADAAFARAVGRPAELSAEAASALQAVVALPAAFGDSPLLSDGAAMFDRLLVVHGEDMDDDDFQLAAARAESWVLLGIPDGGGCFADLWPHLHAAGSWREEAGRLVARLSPGDPDGTEPLFDRPEVELRFAGDALAEVTFPMGMSLAEAKRFLAAELGEANPRFPAAGEWTESADRIACGCPGLTGDPADLGDGVRETLADGLTVAVEFAKPAWDRATAEAWLAARALPPARTAVLPRALVVA